MSSNGSTPAATVTEYIACRICDRRKALPVHRPRTWTFVCKGCGHTIEVDLS